MGNSWLPKRYSYLQDGCLVGGFTQPDYKKEGYISPKPLGSWQNLSETGPVILSPDTRSECFLRGVKFLAENLRGMKFSRKIIRGLKISPFQEE